MPVHGNLASHGLLSEQGNGGQQIADLALGQRLAQERIRSPRRQQIAGADGGGTRVADLDRRRGDIAAHARPGRAAAGKRRWWPPAEQRTPACGFGRSASGRSLGPDADRHAVEAVEHIRRRSAAAVAAVGAKIALPRRAVGHGRSEKSGRAVAGSPRCWCARHAASSVSVGKSGRCTSSLSMRRISSFSGSLPPNTSRFSSGSTKSVTSSVTGVGSFFKCVLNQVKMARRSLGV